MQHPPYSTFDFMADRMWMLFLVIAILSSLFCRSKKAFIAAGCLTILIVDRSHLNSIGGMGVLFEIPLLTIAITVLIPSDWFKKGFFRRHIFIPVIFLALFLFAQVLENLRLLYLVEGGDNWWFCFHPLAFISIALMIATPLVIITNEIWQGVLHKKQKSNQSTHSITASGGSE